ncbi:hypothetical protein [Cypionkella sp. TWP1-2-1b2]|uniref:hypothetical protein n=1 Tax=Cypionkella sp. TWP1-2-1b2 TaxID=2804675 RepID=UPI003CF14046
MSLIDKQTVLIMRQLVLTQQGWIQAYALVFVVFSAANGHLIARASAFNRRRSKSWSEPPKTFT